MRFLALFLLLPFSVNAQELSPYQADYKYCYIYATQQMRDYLGGIRNNEYVLFDDANPMMNEYLRECMHEKGHGLGEGDYTTEMYYDMP